MSAVTHEFWPWREKTTWMDEAEGMRKFKALYLDAEGNPMTREQWFTSNYETDRLRQRLEERAVEMQAEGASFPEDASWV